MRNVLKKDRFRTLSHYLLEDTNSQVSGAVSLVREYGFSKIGTRLGSSAEPSQQVCRLQSAPLLSQVKIRQNCTTSYPIVVQAYTL